MNILNIVGTRPNFMKIAPLMAAFRETPGLSPLLVHTGQHYDPEMNRVFFEQLGIPRPDIDLEAGSGTLAAQVSEIIRRIDPVLEQRRPDAVLVVGDVNSTVACALAAAYRGIPVIHVEAGLRSFDRSMPEEINRITTDRLSDLLFATETSAVENLRKEGVPPEKVHLVGNVMVDTLLRHRETAERESRILERLGLEPKGYAVLTLHRPSNVDEAAVLKRLLEALGTLARRLPVVFPVHPRTEKRIAEFRLESLAAPLLRQPPLPYLDMLRLMAHAALVLTDSGGMQEETTVLGVPCLTLRENTERPVTVSLGTNTLVGTDPERLLNEAETLLTGGGRAGRCPELWDGRAAGRIAKILSGWRP